jgi:phage tail-like protein
MRGVIDGDWELASAAPLAQQLPAVFQEDEFTQRFLIGFDDALAPVLATLNDLPAYFDPALAPEDFVAWLAGWVGVTLDDAWTEHSRRAVVSEAIALHRRRGTAAGIAGAVSLAVDGDVEIVDSGGSAWSRIPGAALPGEPTATVHVKVSVDDPVELSLERLAALVAAVKPAHVAHTVEVVARDVRRSRHGGAS